MSQSLKERYQSSALFGANAPYVEDLYAAYQRDPASVPENWRRFFAGMGAAEPAQVTPRPASAPARLAVTPPQPGPIPRAGDAPGEKQAAVARLIQVYSQRGYQIADLDPLDLTERRIPQVLRPEYLGLTEADMDTEFFTTGVASTGGARMRLKDIIALLRRVYSGKVGADFAHLSRGRERQWLRERLEQGMLGDPFSVAERRHILGGLTAAEGIERLT
jgi:2-oxoglutarate dehydrogenase E1 component